MCATAEMLFKTYRPNYRYMEKLNFTIRIHASAEKVWNTLWEDETYRKWTAVFAEGSYALSDWKEGSRVKFLNGKGDGMYSTIDKSIPEKFISFRHLGEIKDGVEQPVDLSQHWSGALENYTLEETNGITDLRVDIDVLESHAEYFKSKFPAALLKLKELAENS